MTTTVHRDEDPMGVAKAAGLPTDVQAVTIETEIVRELVLHLVRRGFVPLRVDFPDGPSESTPTPEGMLVHAMSGEDCFVNFRSPTGRIRWVQLIPGNGRDIVSDWGNPTDKRDGWDAAIEAFLDVVEKWEAVKAPQTLAEALQEAEKPATTPGATLPTLGEALDALARLSGAVSGTTHALRGSMPEAADAIRDAQDEATALLGRARPLLLAEAVGIPAESVTQADIPAWANHPGCLTANPADFDDERPLVLVEASGGAAATEVYGNGDPCVVLVDWDALDGIEASDWAGLTPTQWDLLTKHRPDVVDDLAGLGFKRSEETTA